MGKWKSWGGALSKVEEFDSQSFRAALTAVFFVAISQRYPAEGHLPLACFFALIYRTGLIVPRGRVHSRREKYTIYDV